MSGWPLRQCAVAQSSYVMQPGHGSREARAGWLLCALITHAAAGSVLASSPSTLGQSLADAISASWNSTDAMAWSGPAGVISLGVSSFDGVSSRRMAGFLLCLHGERRTPVCHHSLRKIKVRPNLAGLHLTAVSAAGIFSCCICWLLPASCSVV